MIEDDNTVVKFTDVSSLEGLQVLWSTCRAGVEFTMILTHWGKAGESAR